MMPSDSVPAGNTLRVIEYGLLFLLLPGLVAAFNPGLPVLLNLWVLALLCLLGLRREPAFDRRQLWNPADFRRHLRAVALRFAVGGPLLLVVAWLALPDCWRSPLVLRHPRLWLLIILAYPLLSVYPQGIVYRSFLLHRYRRLFPGEWPIAIASAVAFALVHSVFHNWMAPALSWA